MTSALRWFDDGLWHKVNRNDPRGRALADKHYSRQTPGAVDFLASGKTFCLLTDDAKAVWGVIENLDPAGGLHWRCAIFRNTGPHLSSDLVREATERTFVYWRRKWGGLPPVPLRTEVDPDKTRRKRDPGRCFVKAGWRRLKERTTKGLVQLEAPMPPDWRAA